MRVSFVHHVAIGLTVWALTLCTLGPRAGVNAAEPTAEPQAGDRSASATTASPVGRVITPKGPLCTGVLIGRYTVLTAAHCLVTRAGDGYFSAALIHFALYPPGDDQLYAKSVSRHVAPDYPLPVSTAPESLSHDWAVLVLDAPLGDQVAPARVTTKADWAAAPGNWRLSVVAFGRARTLRPTIRHGSCRLLDQSADLLFHDCVVEPGSSGSVLLGLRDGVVHALAVNVAVRRGAAPRTSATLLPEGVRPLAVREPAETSAWESPFSNKGQKASWN